MHLDSWTAAKRLSRTGMADGGSHRSKFLTNEIALISPNSPLEENGFELLVPD
jgi:hypothetical protein